MVDPLVQQTAVAAPALQLVTRARFWRGRDDDRVIHYEVARPAASRTAIRHPLPDGMHAPPLLH